MKRLVLAAAACALAVCADAAERFAKKVKIPVGDLEIACADPGAWTFDVSSREADGVGVVTISLSAPEPAEPPVFDAGCTFPARDFTGCWNVCDSLFSVGVDWGGRYNSDFGHGLPVYAMFNDNDESRLTVAASEALRWVEAHLGVQEEGCMAFARFRFFTRPEAPLARYSVSLRFDARAVPFARAVREAAAWVEDAAGIRPCAAPEAAFEPLYSTWYGFHQNLFAAELEAELEIAAAAGMKTVIVDDGWECDDNNRGYAFTGDWVVSKNRFPDMKAHVDRVHALGMKYMVWYSVPFVGHKSANFARFRGKYLKDIPRMGCAVLDPRFPDVRAFIVDTYRSHQKAYGYDGFKLDFIDSFEIVGGETDPAVAENYAGRDIKSIPEAVNKLMSEIMAALRAVNPDVLVEFRQSYIGPYIRQYGNMLRVADCPGDYRRNRVGIANLRLVSGQSAVHADMLEWNAEEPAEKAARNILSSIFGVVQYSIPLAQAPQAHRDLVRHWIAFSDAHRETLLKGDFRPRHPEAGYPVIEAESAAERVVAVYNDSAFASLPGDGKPAYVLNATGRAGVAVEFGAAAEVTAFDTFGRQAGAPRKFPAGLARVPCPEGGYVKAVK